MTEPTRKYDNEQNAALISMTLEEAAAFLNISPSALRYKAKCGELPGAKIGKCWVFLQNDLADAIRSRYVGSQQALRVQPMENSLCYTNATIRGGLDSQPQTELEYDALLKPATK